MVNNELENENINENQSGTDSDSYIDKIDNEEKKTDTEQINWRDEIYSWFRIVIVAFVVATLINCFVILNADIPSGSMENTIMTHSRVIGNRLSYKLGDPKRGDIVIFEYPDNPSELYIKRIIGLPGEKVTIKGDKIYINDSEVALDEDYLKEPWGEAEEITYEVPQDCYFMLGDNRNNSKDSRRWENKYVKREAIKAKAMVVYWPFEHMNVLSGHAYESDK